MNNKENKLQVLRKEYEKKSFTTKEAKKLGISSRMLSFYIKEGKLERIGRGLYIFPGFDSEDDFEYQDLALRAKSIKSSVICLISALNFWDITEDIGREFWLAIPNNHAIPQTAKNTRFIRPRDLETGVEEIVIAGQEVKITTAERSVCDAFKFLPEETAVTALRAYMSQEEEKINIEKLLTTAKVLKAYKVIEIIKEVAEANAKDYPKISRESFTAYLQWLSKNNGKNCE